MNRTVVGLPTYLTSGATIGWQDLGLCAQTDPDAFFPDKGLPWRAAKAVCLRCPVRAECLDAALGRGELFGIWGGMSRTERAVEQRRRTARRSAA